MSDTEFYKHLLDKWTTEITDKGVSFPHKKIGRQGYVLLLVRFDLSEEFNDNKPWTWEVESQNGFRVAESSTFFRSRWDAKRSAMRLLGTRISDIRTVRD